MSSWHSKPLPRLLEELDVRPGGLSQHQAEGAWARRSQ